MSATTAATITKEPAANFCLRFIAFIKKLPQVPGGRNRDPERESADTVSDDTDAGNPTDAVVVATATPVTLAVRYNGILPDMFAEGRDVIVEGRVTDRTFHAETLLTTCPSKYEADVVPEGESPTDAPADQIARG